MSKKVLVVGANFLNKGAQSMLFVVTDEIKKIYSDCDVYFASIGEKYDEQDYTFKRLLYTKEAQDIALGDNLGNLQKIKKLAKALFKYVFRIDKKALEKYAAKKIVPQLDLIIDVSGYVLADITSNEEHEYYLDNIRLAKKYGIPMLIMPQSFGPFDYSNEKKYLINEIKELLQYPKVIFAREEEGYRALVDNFGLKNVRQSRDLVLQNKGISKSNVCTGSYKNAVPKILTDKNVAIIPNYHCFVGKYEQRSYNVYRDIVQSLINAGNNVYIFRHATADLDICKNIKALFLNNDKVHLIDREFDCLEYDELVKNFDFVICSRFHGCVHAYKNLIPNIILGWATKYKVLAESLGQGQFLFDLMSDEFDENKLIQQLEHMISNHEAERFIIGQNLVKIQEDNCFTVLKEIEW